MASKLSVHKPNTFLGYSTDKEISEKWNFFAPSLKAFNGKIFGASTHRISDSEYLYEWLVQFFLTLFWFWSDGNIHADVYKAKHDDDVTMQMRRKTLVR